MASEPIAEAMRAWERGQPEALVALLERLARAAAARWPELAPLGGRRWTQEDVDSALSSLVEIAERRAFRRAVQANGASDAGLRAYLLTALRNELLQQRIRRQREALTDEWSAFADTRAGAAPCPAEIRAVAHRALERLSPEERAVLTVWLREGAVPVRAHAERLRLRRMTMHRRRARIVEVLADEAARANLDRTERLALLHALRALLLEQEGHS